MNDLGGTEKPRRSAFWTPFRPRQRGLNGFGGVRLGPERFALKSADLRDI